MPPDLCMVQVPTRVSHTFYIQVKHLVYATDPTKALCNKVIALGTRKPLEAAQDGVLEWGMLRMDDFGFIICLQCEEIAKDNWGPNWKEKE